MKFFNYLILFFLLSYSAFADEVVITNIPLSATNPDTTMNFAWLKVTSDNIPVDSSKVTMRYSRISGNYDNEIPSKFLNHYKNFNSFSFKASEYLDNDGNKILDAGLYYAIFDYNYLGTSILSKEFQFIVESQSPVIMIAPQSTSNDGIDESVPTFMWEANSGVPYYHIFLSDEPITIDENTGTVSGISAIWQAITSKTSIQYGTEDPSGEFSDIPAPPLMPGVEYNWLVLNNYGNSVATSSAITGLPSTFTIKSNSNIIAPVNIFPTDGSSLNSTTNSTINFSWENGGKDVNLYEVYLFVADSINGVEAKVNIWKGTTTDTNLVFNADQTLYNKTYFWKVYALDEKGIGKVSEMTSFDYHIDVSWLNVRTYSSNGNNLSFVNLKAEPIEGSADVIPYISNKNGSGGTRQFLPGTYKINASKDGYLDNSEIADLTVVNDTTFLKIYLSPAPSSVYGLVLDNKDSSGVGIATVTAISGDKNLTTTTDENGSYTLDLNSSGQWTISASKNEYESSIPINILVENGENKEINNFFVEKSKFAIFGTITNTSGDPIARATVEIYKVGENLPYVFATTADNGFYTFNVPYGDWIVKVNYPGFASESKELESLGEQNEVNFTLVKGGQIKGTIYKKEYIPSKGEYGTLAQLAEANVGVINTTTNDTTFILTDIYGKFSLGVSYGTYRTFARKDGYTDNNYPSSIVINSSNRTYSGTDITLTALASVQGLTYSRNDSGLIKNVTITLKNSEDIISSKKTDMFGKYRIENIIGGNYTISAAKKGYDITDPKIINATTGIISGNYDFYLNKGDIHTLNFTSSYGGITHSSGNFKILSPFVENGELINSNFFVDSLAKGTYTYSYHTGNNKILDITSGTVIIKESDGDTININRTLPFSTNPVDTFSSNSEVINFSITGQNIGSMYVFYRVLGDGNYKSKLMIFSNGNFTTTDTLSSTGVTIDYYYSITDSSTATTYSNKNRPYYSFSKLVSKLDYIKWNPSLPDTTKSRIVLIDTPYNTKIDGYNRGILSNSLISKVNWESSDTNIVSFLKKNTLSNETNKIYPLKEGVAIIKATVTGTRNESLVLLAKIEVFDGTIDSAYFVRIDKTPDDHRISNRKVAKFTVKAKITKKDKTKETISILSPIKTFPSKGLKVEAGSISFNSNFSGQVELSSRINGYGTIVYNQSPTIRERNRHFHVTSPVNEDDTISNYRGLSIYFPDSSFVTKGIDELSITKEIFTTNQQILGKYESIGEILNLKLLNNKTFKKPVKLIYTISNDYKNRENFILSYYNDSLLEFEVVDSVKLNKKDSIVIMETSHFSTYSLMAEREPLSIKNVVFSPNPFSPYVYARDNDRQYPGLGIKFFSSSQEDNVPNLKVEIFTMSGVRIWVKKGSQDIESGRQEFNWDGRESVTGLMSPNGRYIVKITASENKTGKVVVYKGIVVLIK